MELKRQSRRPVPARSIASTGRTRLAVGLTALLGAAYAFVASGSPPPTRSETRVALPPATMAAPSPFSDEAAGWFPEADLSPVAVLACDSGVTSVTGVVRQVAREISSRHILYRSQPLSDCSGMAHRVLDALTLRCPDAMRPDVDEARSASAIARWYEGHDLVVRIDHPVDADAWMVPGVLAFYERQRRSRLPGLDRVGHVGVIVGVNRDEDGRVSSYEMFHGRSAGETASVTAWHRRDAFPPLGNGPDALVALAFPEPSVAIDALESRFAGDGLAEAAEPVAGAWQGRED